MNFYLFLTWLEFLPAGVTTIAGGRLGRGGGHVDGPSEDAKFSNDFDVVYIGSSCSLLVIDRGNQAIREIQLHFDDCAYQYGSGFPLGKQLSPNCALHFSMPMINVYYFSLLQELQCLSRLASLGTCWHCCNAEWVQFCLPMMWVISCLLHSTR